MTVAALAEDRLPDPAPRGGRVVRTGSGCRPRTLARRHAAPAGASRRQREPASSDDGSAPAHARGVRATRAGEWIDRRSAATGDPTVGVHPLARPRAEPTSARGVGWSIWGAGPAGTFRRCPPRTIALDGTAAMLRPGPQHGSDVAPGPGRSASPAVRQRVTRRRMGGAVTGAPATGPLVPMALWDLHRCAAGRGAGLSEAVRGRPGTRPDRRRRRPRPVVQRLARTAAASGARAAPGSAWTCSSASDGGAVDHLQVWATRQRTLADTVGPDMRLLLVGLNPSLVAADAGVAFHRAGNRAWPALAAAGLATVDRDPVAPAPPPPHRHDRPGQACLAAGRRAQRRGVPRAASTVWSSLCSWLAPDAVCIVGLAGWRAAVDRRATTGVQPRRSAADPCT